MKTVLNKQLVNDVLGRDDVNKAELYDDDRMVWLQIDSDGFIDGCNNITTAQLEDDIKPKKYHLMNGYEFAFGKCKDWALRKKRSRLHSNTEWKMHPSEMFGKCIIENASGKRTKDFVADTEYEAIIKACEWIAKNKSA